MKKSLSIITTAACITATCFFSTTQVSDSKCQVDDPPVIILPPYKLPTKKLAFVIFKINTPPENATNAV